MKAKRLFLFLVLVLALAACGSEEPEVTPAPTAEPTNTAVPPTPTAALSTETIRGQAMIDSIQIEILESFPVQVNVIARGELSDGCTELENVIQQLTGSTFQVAVTTLRPADRMCTQALVPFTETIPLDVAGLDAGTYEVVVNGRSGSFTLEVDNRVADAPATPASPTPTAEPETAASGGISGLVWHDVCAVAGGEGDEAAQPSEGCVAAPGGGFQANGVRDADEPGIGGVLVSLGEGACPADGLAEATTDADGAYAFADLAPGDYCVTINPLEAQNEPLLVPGGWTAPGVDVGSIDVSVAAGETAAANNFGWDFQFLPLPEVDPATCRNSFEFVSDVTIPDDTEVAAGTEFVKTWRVRNNGTCPWTTEYTLVAVDDEPLPGDTEAPLETAVAPGQTAELSVTLTAPDEPGTYRSNWQLANAAGERFGVNGFIEDAIYVRFVVVEEGTAIATPAPNSAVIGGVAWADYCLVQSNGTPSVGCVETAEGSGFYTADGTYAGYESSIPELTVTLLDGTCVEGAVDPAAVLETAVTDVDGLYRFEGLEAGTYCVYVDAFSEENVDILIPGDWTYPARGVGRLTVILTAGEERLTVDFGWDYQFD